MKEHGESWMRENRMSSLTRGDWKQTRKGTAPVAYSTGFFWLNTLSIHSEVNLFILFLLFGYFFRIITNDQIS
jgi:hypothetical protein